MIDLKDSANKKEIAENENPDEVFNIAQKIDFNKQKKS